MILDVIGGEYQECASRKNHTMESKYPINRVPNFLFKKDGSSEYFKCCLDCRLYNRENDNKIRLKHKHIVEEQSQLNDYVRYCSWL
jgi:hypothetical protein